MSSQPLSISSSNPSKFTLQWHLTDQCNLRCKHCYQQEYTSGGLSLELALSVAQQYSDLLLQLSVLWQKSVRGHINFTGGEPLLYPYLRALVDEIAVRHPHITYAFLSNGTLIDKDFARWLKATHCRFVQLSVEGSEHTHNSIRGILNFENVKRAAQLLKSAGVKVMLSFTANQLNYKEFGAVAVYGRSWGVHKVWTDRMVPTCAQSDSSLDTLNVIQTSHYVQLINKAKTRFAPFSSTQVVAERALQFMQGGGEVYRCTAGHNLLALLPNGDILPCRRLPIVVGNIFTNPLAETYLSSPVLLELRDKNIIPAQCKACPYSLRCRGGARCIAYAALGSWRKADPACAILKRSL